MEPEIPAVRAPEFPEGLAWLNTEKPLELRRLRGKVVVLDFWTYCCINCMHVLPDLRRLEHKYRDELVVIGVHSAKFTSERESANIREAILRYGIAHPVVNDSRMEVWKRYGIHAWPTLVLIDPAGNVVGQMSGEGVYEPFDRAIGLLVKEFDARGQIDRRALSLQPERAAREGVLAFPGKVLADEKGGRLFIADSNHHRILVAALADFTVQEIIGSGEEGLADGGFAAAKFFRPQGMALEGGRLYIADTENHAIRVADLEKRTVQTVAGTGKQARGYRLSGEGRKLALNSPWDLLAHKGLLYVAMAGPHQIWRLDLSTGKAAVHAGSGREARIDGALAEAALAQPSGIATDGSKLYFADSEDSSIRSADLDESGRVETIVGGDLFDFGDRDGKGLQVRLQHPLGVAWHGGVLYVADTYNNRIKVVDPRDRSCRALAGTGKEGAADGGANEATFNEPGGLSVAGETLYIADTNNHAIRVMDLKTGRVRTAEIRLPKLTATTLPITEVGDVVLEPLPEQTIGLGNIPLRIDVKLPKGCKRTDEEPVSVEIVTDDEKVAHFGGKASPPTLKTLPAEATITAEAGQTNINITVSVSFCREGDKGLCYYYEVRIIQPVVVKAGGRGELAIQCTIPAPK